MKGFIPVILGIALLTPATASGEGYNDARYLNDGSVIRGTMETTAV